MDEKNKRSKTAGLSSPQAPERIPDNPDRILRDLLQTEKEIAAEGLIFAKSRFEKERLQWENLIQDKQRIILELQSRLSETEIRIKSLQQQLNDDAQKQIDLLKISSQELDAKKNADRKKWQLIEDEIKAFRENASDAQNRLVSERDKIIEIKKKFEYNEKLLKEQISSKEEETARVNELMLKKEEAYLRDKALKDEELHLLQEQHKTTVETAANERNYNTKVMEEKDKNIFELQKGLQNAIVQLTTERQSAERLNEKMVELQKHIERLEDEQKTARQSFEEERLSLQRTLKEEQSNLERYKTESAVRESMLKKEAAEQIERLSKSSEIAEQQLSEEQRLRKALESKLQSKETELQQVMKQNEEIASDWKKIIASEREILQKRQSETVSECERAKQSKEEEITRLHQKVNSLLSDINQSMKPRSHKRAKHQPPDK